jgi:enterochelin esterase-like enzyme
MLLVSLLHGAVPITVGILGGLALIGLTAARGRTWWLRMVPVAALIAVVLTVAIVYFVESVWKPFPDDLPIEVRLSIGVALFGIAVGVLRLVRGKGWPRWVAMPLAIVVVLIAAISQVNIYYGQVPTVGALLGEPLPNQVSLGKLPKKTAVVEAPKKTTHRTLESVWFPPATLPKHGVVSDVTIPGKVSRFKPRHGMVYLPPAYLTTPRAKLPVLVLLLGTPANMTDWFTAGRLAERMDKFAAAHKGLAPVVVLPDIGGSMWGNPLCIDSKLGHAATYLDVDVPAWITSTLQVDLDHSKWAVGGLSSGGTCAMQTTVRSPTIYPTFASLSGQDAPNLSTHAKTLKAAFGGSEEAFRRASPLAQLQSGRKLPGSAGFLTVGEHDWQYRPEQERVARAFQAAGVPVQLELIPGGGHNWRVFGAGLERAVPWLAARWDLAVTRQEGTPR